MVEDKVAKRISQFRTELFKYMPFYGDILSHLSIVESCITKTAGTDGRTIYYNSKYFSKLSDGQQNYVMMHELFHVILMHSLRLGDRDPDIWNIAADYVVNGLIDNLINELSMRNILRINFERPSSGCFLDCYRDESVEELYIKLYKKHTKAERDLIIPGIGEGELKQIIKEITEIVQNAAKMWTRDPSTESILRQLRILTNEHTLPWNVLLKRYLIEDDAEDTSYDHPERKYLHMDMILPGVGQTSIKSKLDDVWAFIDVSGSIGEDEMNKYITQLHHICKQFDVNVNIGFWDTEVEAVYKKVKMKDLVNCKADLYGGTDATCIYDYLDENHIMPKVMLILTDGYFDEVEYRRTEKYRNRTIMVITCPEGIYHNNMGRIARL